MSTQPANRTNRPGTSCIVCRRRKLKCSREPDGCSNCSKTNLPCVYPALEASIGRKRGPYKKREKPLRESHIEHVVKYLSNPVTVGEASDSGQVQGSRLPDESQASTPVSQGSSGKSPAATSTFGLSPSAPATTAEKVGGVSYSEELVTDALIALSKTSVSVQTAEEGEKIPLGTPITLRASGTQNLDRSHPPLCHVFDLWQLFTSRVDPVTKVIHCPTFVRTLLSFLDNPKPGATETLAFAVYYAAVSSCSATEAKLKFGQSKTSLLQRYGQIIESTMAQNYDKPGLESMQGLLIYIICLRRHDPESGLWTLFSLALRNAQLIGLHQDPGTAFTPYEAELRRRCWWTICGLEARCGEEVATRSNSLLINNSVDLPANIDDCDLQPAAGEPPKSRVGVTAMSFAVARWEMMRLTTRIWKIKKAQAEERLDEDIVKRQQCEVYQDTKEHLELLYLRHCHESRPLDWMLMGLAEVMLTKVRLAIDYPWGHTVSGDMTAEQRLDMLQASVVIIRNTHLLHTHSEVADWFWFYQGFVQWHALAVVVAELGRSTNEQFSRSAWAVLNPILKDWETVYEGKKHDPPWDHVNTLILRAKYMAEHQHRATQQSNIVQQGDLRIAHTPISQPAYRPSTVALYESGPPATYHGVSELWYAEAGASTQSAPLQTSNPPPISSVPNPDFNCASAMSGLDIDFSSFADPGDVDFDAINAVFNSPSWEMAGPLGYFDMEMTG